MAGITIGYIRMGYPSSVNKSINKNQTTHLSQHSYQEDWLVSLKFLGWYLSQERVLR
jgi:hypothetical protein